jgi:very-short-patch-repair endonuclease
VSKPEDGLARIFESELPLAFHRQFQFGHHRVDFFIPEAGVFVEVDGIFHELENQRRRDHALDDLAASCGLMVWRIPADEAPFPYHARRLVRSLIDAAKYRSTCGRRCLLRKDELAETRPGAMHRGGTSLPSTGARRS